MAANRKLVIVVFSAIAVMLAAIHAPGQMSVDSVSALYEGAIKQAAGWGPTFFSAFLKWLGDGVVGSSLFVAINCYATYGCMAALLMSRSDQSVSKWQECVAWLLALNPLFMFYVGIVWKDVMLTTVAMVAGTCMLLAADREGRARYALLITAAVLASSMVLIRQQGILLSAPFALVLAGMITRGWRGRWLGRSVAFCACLAAMVGATASLDTLSNKTIRPQAASPISVGFLTIRAYDIAGMIKYAKSGDTDVWAGASEQAKAEIRSEYSPQRIDTIWHVPEVRNYFNSLSAEQYSSIWMAGIKYNPAAYLDHRIRAFAYLLGLGSVDGCVPAYWGVAGVPEQMAALSFREEMDDRARIIGRAAHKLYRTPVFRNWFYALILLAGTVSTICRTRKEQRWVCGAIAVAAWLYLSSFVPTTIACDFRYLYPVAGLASILAIYLLTQTRLLRSNTWVTSSK